MSAPRPDLLSALPAIIAARIKLALPQLVSCEGIAGRFDVEALKRYGVSAPAVLVSFLGLSPAASLAGPVHTFDAEFAGFVVTKEVLGLPRDMAAANICAALARLIPRHRWGMADVDSARDVRVIPILTAVTNGQGVSLWSVVWKQALSLTALDPAVPLPMTLYVGADLYGADAEQIITGARQ